MKIHTAAAKRGGFWLKQGLHYFRLHYFAFLLLSLAWLFLLMIPAQYLPRPLEMLIGLASTPLFPVSVFILTEAVVKGQPARGRVFSQFFRTHRLDIPAIGLLLLTYIVLWLVTVGATALIDGGEFFAFAVGAKPVATMEELAKLWTPQIAMTFFVSGLVSHVLVLFTLPLILWHQLKFGLSLFGSVVGVLRNWAPILVFLILLLGGSLVVLTVLMMILDAVGAPVVVVSFIVLLFSLILLSVMGIGLYFVFTDIFVPEEKV